MEKDSERVVQAPCTMLNLVMDLEGEDTAATAKRAWRHSVKIESVYAESDVTRIAKIHSTMRRGRTDVPSEEWNVRTIVSELLLGGSRSQNRCEGRYYGREA
jgi:hypothetical protein